jgi:hypothetical protein
VLDSEAVGKLRLCNVVKRSCNITTSSAVIILVLAQSGSDLDQPVSLGVLVRQPSRDIVHSRIAVEENGSQHTIDTYGVVPKKLAESLARRFRIHIDSRETKKYIIAVGMDYIQYPLSFIPVTFHHSSQEIQALWMLVAQDSEPCGNWLFAVLPVDEDASALDNVH